MRITVVGAIVIVSGIIVAVLILERLVEKENPQSETERSPGGPAKIIGSPGV